MGCHFLLQGIFPTQGSNSGLPHCRQMLYHLSHQGSPLKGDPNINSPHSLSQEARKKLCLVQNKLQKQFFTHIRLQLPLQLFILPSLHSLTGLLTQQEYPIEWIYTHFRRMRSLTPHLDLIVLIIINGRNRAGL